MTGQNAADLAEIAYAAYGQATGGKNYRGEPMPKSWDLGETIRGAWVAAAGAVAGEVLRDMADRIDRGPDIPLPPSVYSALLRERAEDLDRAGADR